MAANQPPSRRLCYSLLGLSRSAPASPTFSFRAQSRISPSLCWCSRGGTLPTEAVQLPTSVSGSPQEDADRGRGEVADELTVLGIVALSAWMGTAVLATQNDHASQMFWLCRFALLGTAAGLLLRSPLIVTAQLVGTIIYHAVWHVEFLSQVLTGHMPLGAAAYMFDGNVTSHEKALSFFEHTFTVGANAWGLARLGPSRLGWVFQTGQTLLAFALTRLFSDPRDNINWLLGAGLPELSPARIGPTFYSLLVVMVPPVLLYLPTNALLLRMAPSQARRSAASLRRAWLALALSLALAAFSVYVGLACDVRVHIPASLLDMPVTGLLPLEKVRSGGDAPVVTSIDYGCPGSERPILLRELPGSLPRRQVTGRSMIVLKQVLRSVPIAEVPSAPQMVLIRGKRGRTGVIVCAVVASDRLYMQPSCDYRSAVETFEVQASLGLAGLMEFLDPASGKVRDPKSNHVVGGEVGGLYVVAVVSLANDAAPARSPLYLLKRTGVRGPDDVAWSELAGGRVPVLRPLGVCGP